MHNQKIYWNSFVKLKQNVSSLLFFILTFYVCAYENCLNIVIQNISHDGIVSENLEWQQKPNQLKMKMKNCIFLYAMLKIVFDLNRI